MGASPLAPGVPRLVLLGSGFAVFSLLKAIDVARYDVTVVSPRNHFIFTPLLPSTTVGTIEFRSIIEPIRAKEGITYVQAECIGIDPDARTLQCRQAGEGSAFTEAYDLLVLGVGV